VLAGVVPQSRVAGLVQQRKVEFGEVDGGDGYVAAPGLLGKPLPDGKAGTARTG